MWPGVTGCRADCADWRRTLDRTAQRQPVLAPASALAGAGLTVDRLHSSAADERGRV